MSRIAYRGLAERRALEVSPAGVTARRTAGMAAEKLHGY
jgi:hypothetical protein